MIERDEQQPGQLPSQAAGQLPERPLRIGIDVAWAGGQPTGTGVYTLELVRALLRHDPYNTYVLYFKDPRTQRNALWDVAAPNVVKRVVGPASSNLRNQALAAHLYRDRIDVFHSTGFFLPYAWVGRKVVTIHDVNFLRFARNWWRPGTRVKWLSLLAQTPLSAHLSSQILAVSMFTARDITHYLHIPPRKIHVVPLGIRSGLMREPLPQEIAAIRQRYRLDDFVLAVGILSPQKNLERLIRAFARVAMRADAPRLKLVLAGRDHGGYGDNVLRPLARSLDCEDKVEFTGYISDGDVRALYAAAHCVAQVSEGEGFGLPVIEAMHCGAPVIAANTTALKEVAGDAALLVDPMDEQNIAAGLARLCGDDQLARDLRERGIGHAQQYTWERAAQQTIAVYRLKAGAKKK